MDGATSAAKVRIDLRDRVGILTLSDPATLNAASIDLMVELQAAFEKLIADPGVRAIIITGDGRAFCSGANLSSRGSESAVSGGLDGPNQALLKTFNPFLSALRRSPKAVVAAVNGVAAGIGVSIALACDLIVAAESAYFLLAFRRIGLVPDGGATYLLPRLIGKARAMELMLLGEKLAGAKALDWGLINRCVPESELLEAAMDLGRALAAGPASLGLTRNLVWASLDGAWHDQIEREAHMQGEASRSEDAIEGVAAFLGKRPAAFTGR